MTEEWRCPNAQDGAFHVVDASTLDPEKCTYSCIHCAERVSFQLVNSGMARARGGFVNPAAVPHDGYNLGPTIKIGGKAVASNPSVFDSFAWTTQQHRVRVQEIIDSFHALVASGLLSSDEFARIFRKAFVGGGHVQS